MHNNEYFPSKIIVIFFLFWGGGGLQILSCLILFFGFKHKRTSEKFVKKYIYIFIQPWAIQPISLQ